MCKQVFMGFHSMVLHSSLFFWSIFTHMSNPKQGLETSMGLESWEEFSMQCGNKIICWICLFNEI